MKLRNEITGDILEVPPPDMLGASFVRFNGRIVETVLYSDNDGGSVTTVNGPIIRVFRDQEFSAYLVEQLRTGAYGK